MEAFCGREATIDRFFGAHDWMRRELECVLYDLWDAGLGPLANVRQWLLAESFSLFEELPGLHAEHSGVSPATGCACPRLYAPVPVKLPQMLSGTLVAIPLEDWEDDLYR